MIGSAQTAEAVATRLEALSVPIVFDPVMIATSGATLADARTIAAFGRLMALASVTTPNLPEAEALGGAAAILRYGCHVVMKGGHGPGDEIVDLLLSPRGGTKELRARRLDTTSTHGTGCSARVWASRRRSNRQCASCGSRSFRHRALVAVMDRSDIRM